MNKILFFICCSIYITSTACAATRQSIATDTTAFNYNYMYPYMNNQMRADLNPGTSVELNANPINTVVRTINVPNSNRRVVARSAAQTSNSATNNTTTTNSTTRTSTTTSVPTNRRVVARSASTSANTRIGNSNRKRVVSRSARGDASYLATATANATSTTQSDVEKVSSSRCLADYIECMDGYCAREDTQYNRCYCSSRLSQIDSQYQTDINRLINQILTMQDTKTWTSEEMAEYWASKIEVYTGSDSWSNIDDALNIDWASMESRVRGQQAFATGHTYCAQHLNGCYYMATNMRDVYRSEISRDCDSYESKLQAVKDIAESVLEANK